MKTLTLNIILIMLCSIGSGQDCSGPLNITLNGSPTGEALSIDPIYSHIYCQDSDQGAIELDVRGGSPEYTCVWSTGVVGEALYNLSAGTYSVTVTDASNCTKEAVIHIIQQHPINQNLFLADYDCCGYCDLRDNGTTFIYQGADYIIHIKDIKDGNNVGNVEACIEITESEQDFNGRKLLKRHWEINTSTEKSIVRLFFSNDELESLRKESNYKQVNDDFIENLNVIKFIGKDNNSMSYETIETYHIQDIQKFGDQGVLYIEIPHHGVLNKRIGYALSIKPKASLNIERIDSEVIAETTGKYTLKTNPVENEIEVLSSKPEELIYGKSYILDTNGQELYSQLLWDEPMHGQQINVSHLTPGIYFYVIWAFNDNAKRVMKFIKI